MKFDDVYNKIINEMHLVGFEDEIPDSATSEIVATYDLILGNAEGTNTGTLEIETMNSGYYGVAKNSDGKVIIKKGPYRSIDIAKDITSLFLKNDFTTVLVKPKVA